MGAPAPSLHAELAPLLKGLFEQQRRELVALMDDLRVKQARCCPAALKDTMLGLMEAQLVGVPQPAVKLGAAGFQPRPRASNIEVDAPLAPLWSEAQDAELERYRTLISSPTTASSIDLPMVTHQDARDGPDGTKSIPDSERRNLAEQKAVELSHVRESLGAWVLANRVSTKSMAWAARIRQEVRRIVEKPCFELFGLLMVVLNSACLGFQVQYQAATLTAATYAEIPNIIFTFLFVIEILMRLIACGGCQSFLTSEGCSWRLFDVFVVVTSILDLILSFTVLVSGATSTVLSNLRFLRMLRVVRIMRALRVLKVLNYIRPVRTLLQSIMCTLKSLLWAMILLAVFIYVFALLFTDAFTTARIDNADGDAIPGVELFGHLGLSMLTLYMSITGGLEWTKAAKDLMEIHFGWAATFAVYVAFCLFAVLNVMTGVFCQSAIESIAQDHDLAMHRIRQEKDQNVETMQGLVERLFANEAGTQVPGISVKDCEKVIEDEFFHNFLSALSLDVADAWTLFKLLDQDGNSMIDVHEFVDGCMKLKGPAKALDMAATKADVNSMKKRVENIEQLVESLVARVWVPIRQRGDSKGSNAPQETWRSARVDPKEVRFHSEARKSRPLKAVQAPIDDDEL